MLNFCERVSTGAVYAFSDYRSTHYSYREIRNVDYYINEFRHQQY